MQAVRGTQVPRVVLSIVHIGAPIRRLSVILYSNRLRFTLPHVTSPTLS
jgi:hypothetical protein